MTGPAPGVLLAKTAWEHPPTEAGYRRLVRRRTLAFLSTLVLPALAIALSTRFLDGDDAIGLTVMSFIGGLVTALFLGLALPGVARTGRILRCYGWRAYPCTYVPRSREDLMVISFGPGADVVMFPAPFRCDLRAKRNDHPAYIWFAGDPRCGGVVSPVGGHYPQRVLTKESPPAAAVAPPVAERAGLARRGRYLRRWC
ncbi:magnesium transporter [Streptomyces sp. NRRL S-118]|uniref:magnesium transporter n=1 Tax=Streptomyces sp. NRRL S-118 TaxID=1463881 RepID=UPI0004CC4298|nr:magnesium transporter [Streptomyces sp. NRRL S-118]